MNDRRMKSHRPHHRNRAALFIGLVASTLVAGLVPAAASAEDEVSTPGGFSDVVMAQLASDGDNLWLGLSGRTKQGEFRARVLAYRGGKWKPLSGSPMSSSSTELQLAIREKQGKRKAQPCMGDTTPKHEARLRCFVGGKWHPIEIPHVFDGMGLEGIYSEGRSITAFFRDMGAKRTKMRVARLRNGRLVPKGPPLNVKGEVIGSLGKKTSDAKTNVVDVGLNSFMTTERWVASLRNGRWSRSKAAPKTGIGPQSYGPVRSKKKLFISTVDAEVSQSWPLTIYGTSNNKKWIDVGGGSVSDGGSSQGGLSPIGRRVWVTWARSEIQGTGSFPTKIFAARINKSGSDFDKRIELWSGSTQVPLRSEAVEFQGAPAFVYLHPVDGQNGLQATVDLSR